MTNGFCVVLSGKSPQSTSPGRSIGAYRIATFLRQINWDVEVIDFCFNWPPQKLEFYLDYLLENKKPKWIGISSTWIVKEVRLIQNVIKKIKKTNPEIKIIIGGQSPFLDDLMADYYIFGYAEIALKKVLDYEFNNGPPLIYKNFYSGKLINAEKDYVANELEDFKVQYIDNDFVNNKTTSVLEVSRGCKFKCAFCTFPYIGIKDNISTAEEHLYSQLMENYHKWGIKSYYISDETLNDRTEKLILLKNVVKRLDFKPNLAAFLRVDLFRSHPEQIELLGEANVWGHYYGVETLNHKTGKAIGKGQNPEYIKETLITLKNYFQKNIGEYKATVSMMIGLPYETKESILESDKWLTENFSSEGAGVNWVPLDIPKDGKLSAMGQDLSKFGYREIEPKITKFPLSRGLYSNRVIWKNDFMDIYEAHDLRKKLGKKYQLSYFTAWTFLPIIGNKKASVLQNTHLPMLNFMYKHEIILKYIEQKLSLVKKQN